MKSCLIIVLEVCYRGSYKYRVWPKYDNKREKKYELNNTIIITVKIFFFSVHLSGVVGGHTAFICMGGLACSVLFWPPCKISGWDYFLRTIKTWGGDFSCCLMKFSSKQSKLVNWHKTKCRGNAPKDWYVMVPICVYTVTCSLLGGVFATQVIHP